MFLIALTRGKCPILNSDARTPGSSTLLPNHLCTPLKELGRPGKYEAVNEALRRWTLSRGSAMAKRLK